MPAPGDTGKGGVNDNPPTIHGGSQVAMDIHKPCVRHGGGDLCAEQLLGAVGIEPADAMHDLRLRLGESLAECFGQE